MSSATMDLQNQERSQMDGYYTLDTWSKPNTAMAPPPALPGGYKRGYIKPKKSKLRWYLVFGLSVLITAVVVVVVALVIHFTTSQNKAQELQNKYLGSDHDDDHSHDDGSGHFSDNATPPQNDITTRRNDHKPTNDITSSSKISSTAKPNVRTSIKTSTTSSAKTTGSLTTINEQTTQNKDSTTSASQRTGLSSIKSTSTSVAEKTPQPTLKSTDKSSLSPSTSKILSTTSQKTTAGGFVPVIPTDKLVDADTSTANSQTTLTPSPSGTTTTSQSSVSAPIHHLNSTSGTSHVDLSATTPAFIRDHSGDVHSTTKDVTTSIDPSSTSSIDTAPIVDNAATTTTTGVTSTVPRVVFESSNVTLSTKSISLLFEAINVPDWDYLQIFRSEDEGGIGDVVAMVTAGRQHPILDIYDQNFRSQISFKNDALALTLQTDVFKCNQTTNFTSVFGTQTTTYLNATTVYIIQEPPTLKVPQAIVEGRNMTMTCSVELFGSNGRLVWKFRPPGINMYFDLSSSHKTTQEWNNCTTIINSTLMFTPQSHDNGSHFRCEIVDADVTVPSNQDLHQDTEFFVVPKTFCHDKRNYTVHPHPYHPCNLVVYCFQTGPLVYHINCSPGTCYDKNKTKCVPIE